MRVLLQILFRILQLCECCCCEACCECCAVASAGGAATESSVAVESSASSTEVASPRSNEVLDANKSLGDQLDPSTKFDVSKNTFKSLEESNSSSFTDSDGKDYEDNTQNDEEGKKGNNPEEKELEDDEHELDNNKDEDKDKDKNEKEDEGYYSGEDLEEDFEIYELNQEFNEITNVNEDINDKDDNGKENEKKKNEKYKIRNEVSDDENYENENKWEYDDESYENENKFNEMDQNIDELVNQSDEIEQSDQVSQSDEIEQSDQVSQSDEIEQSDQVDQSDEMSEDTSSKEDDTTDQENEKDRTEKKHEKYENKHDNSEENEESKDKKDDKNDTDDDDDDGDDTDDTDDNDDDDDDYDDLSNNSNNKQKNKKNKVIDAIDRFLDELFEAILEGGDYTGNVSDDVQANTNANDGNGGILDDRLKKAFENARNKKSGTGRGKLEGVKGIKGGKVRGIKGVKGGRVGGVKGVKGGKVGGVKKPSGGESIHHSETLEKASFNPYTGKVSRGETKRLDPTRAAEKEERKDAQKSHELKEKMREETGEKVKEWKGKVEDKLSQSPNQSNDHKRLQAIADRLEQLEEYLLEAELKAPTDGDVPKFSGGDGSSQTNNGGSSPGDIFKRREEARSKADSQSVEKLKGVGEKEGGGRVGGLMKLEGEATHVESKGGGRVGGLMKLEGKAAHVEGKGGGRVGGLMKLEGEAAHMESKGGGRVGGLMKLEGKVAHVEGKGGGRVGGLMKTDVPPVYSKEVPEGHRTVEKAPETHMLAHHGEILSENGIRVPEREAPPAYSKKAPEGSLPAYSEKAPEGHRSVEKGPENHMLARHEQTSLEGEYRREHIDSSSPENLNKVEKDKFINEVITDLGPKGEKARKLLENVYEMAKNGNEDIGKVSKGAKKVLARWLERQNIADPYQESKTMVDQEASEGLEVPVS